MQLQLSTILCIFSLAWLGDLIASANAEVCDLSKTPLEVRLAGTSARWDKMAENAKRGFELFEHAVNSEGPFKGQNPPFCLQDGRPIRVKLTLWETNIPGVETSIKATYEQMINDNNTDFFLAPSSSRDTLLAANVTDAAKKILMAHNSVAPNIYNDFGFKYLFTTDAMATDYMQDALRILKAQGATTLAAAWENHTELFNQASCHGALGHARNLGFDIKDTFVFDKVDLTRYIRSIAELRPDVFVACGSMTDSINTVVTSRALGFSPKAMVIMQSTTQTFIQAVGAPNANYLLSPVTWYKDIEEGKACRVFESASSFAQSFVQMHQVEPTYHSASAAAAGMALLAAVEQLGAVGPADEIAEALRSLDEMSFYGRLKFTSAGTLENKSCATLQVQRLPDDRSPQDRFTESRIVPVFLNSSGQEPMWPTPTWEQKELEVFPCPPGQVVNQSDILRVSCEPCDVGRYRSQSSLACTDCGVGFYSDVKGLAECKFCPAGADCGPNKVIGVPLASPGYYKLPLALTYSECSPGSLCLGGNQCAEHHFGVMCAQCETGYTVKQANFEGKNKVCAECPNEFRNMILIAACFLVYTLYITMLGYLTAASSSSVRAIHSIIMKKIVNHVQLASTAWYACEFDDIWDLQLLSDLTQDPMRSFLSLDCLLKEYDVDEYKARVVIGLSGVPVVLLMNFCIFTVLMLFRLRTFLRDAHINRHTRARDQMVAEQRRLGHELGRHSEGKDGDQGQDDISEMSSNSSDSSHMPTTSLQVRWQALQNTMVHSLQWGIVWIFILHPMVVKMLLEGITCEERDVMRLKSNLDTICNTSDHKLWFWLCLVGLAIYGLGIPLVNFILLHRVRHRLMQLSVRRIYGFLYNGFESHWYYFEVVHMLRKVLILLFASIPVMYVRIVAMLCLSFAFLALHIFCNPYDNRDYFILDKLETTSLLALILTLQVRLFFDLRNEIESSSPFVHDVSTNRIFDFAMWGCCIACHIYFWLLAFYSLFRNSVMKLWHLRAECAPESLNTLQRLLLKFEPHMNRVKFDSKTHELDLSALGQKERHFLYVALCDTMECYLNTDRHFHPGRILTAVRRAISLCVRDRNLRAQQLLSLMQNRSKTKGWFNWGRHLFFEMRHAMLPGSVQRDKKTTKEKVSASKKAARRRRRLQELALMDHSATVEELQNALMLCWPEILEHRPQFFMLKQPPAQVEQQAAAKSKDVTSTQPDDSPTGKSRTQALKVDPNSSSASDMDSANHKAEVPKLDPKELAQTLNQAAQPMAMGTVVLRRRHSELTQEVWLLRSEVAALKQHLSTIDEASEAAAPQASRQDGQPFEAAPPSALSDAGSADMVDHSANDANCNIVNGVPVLSIKEAVDQVIELVGRLRARGFEAESAELRAMGARLLTMQRARAAATPSAADAGTPSAANSGAHAADAETDAASSSEFGRGGQRQKDVEAKVVDFLQRGEGWQEMTNLANRAADVLHSIVMKLRHRGLEWDANSLEALTKRIGTGLVTKREVQPEELQHKTNSWGAHAEAESVETDVMALISLLQSLRQTETAMSVKVAATRLLAIDHLRHSSRSRVVRDRRRVIRINRNRDDVTLRPSAEKAASDAASKVLATLQQDETWRLMGTVAAECLIDLGDAAAHLRKKGFEEEGDAVVSLVDELCASLTAELPDAMAREGDAQGIRRTDS